MRREKVSIEKAYEKLKHESNHELQVMQKDYALLASEVESQALEMSNLRRKLEIGANSKDSELKRKLKGLSDTISDKEKLIQKQDREIQQLRKELAIANKKAQFSKDDFPLRKKSPPVERPPSSKSSSPRSRSTERSAYVNSIAFCVFKTNYFSVQVDQTLLRYL